MWKERGCREDAKGKGDDKGKMWRGRGMIKGRGCREDVEGKGDGQAMVVRCHPRAVSKNHPTTQRAPMIERGHG